MSTVVSKASAILEISEYEVMWQGYVEWFGREPSPREIDAAFGELLRGKSSPYWAVGYARAVVRRFEEVEEARSRETQAMLRSLWKRLMSAL